jgi:4,5-DOPA dioxygenase extradiol
MRERMPVIFFGHGSPMNALLTNAYTAAWGAVGRRIARPRAVLSISAHWFIPRMAVTAMSTPRTIHDFGGFPRALFEVQYPAPGDPELAARVQETLYPLEVEPDNDWGLDHGTWSVLRHVFPAADIPVVQLSIDETQPAAFHYEVGRRLRPLRDEGILLMGSGDIVHNLHAYARGRHPVDPYPWAIAFEAHARELIARGKHTPLVDYESLGNDALLSVPTPEHYLPLLYVLGAGTGDEPVSFPVEGIDGGSVSMLAVQLG